jgi:signal transduction histidine kinase
VTWLVEEVVDLGRVSGGRLALQVGPADLAQLARKVVDRFGDELRRAGCEVRLDASTPVRGSWDVARLEHTLGSLVLAAIKSGGGHPIEVAVIPADGDGGARDSACVAVRDGGEGLPDEERALVFGRFEPLLAGLKAGSPVLGLWLGRAVLEAHGGRLVLAPGLATLHLPKTGGGDSGLIRES